jgi:hypothetical protein
MKHLRIAGLCLASMLPMGMAVATTASAAPVWEACAEGVSGTKYSTNQCLKAESGGKWSWQEIKSTDKVAIQNLTLTLADTKTPLGVTRVRCDTGGVGAGTVGPGGTAVIKNEAVEKASENCRGLEGGCESNKIEKVEGVDLPWQAEVFETEAKFLAKIKADGGGEPGWAVTCKTALGSKTDTCEREGSNNYEQLVLLSIFSGSPTRLLEIGLAVNLHKSKCTEGGAESGEVTAPQAIALEDGAALRVEA